MSEARKAISIFAEEGMGETERWVSAAGVLCTSLRRGDKVPESLDVGKRATDVAERVLPATSVVRYQVVQTYAESLQKSGKFADAQKLINDNMSAVEALGDVDNSPLPAMLSTLGACYMGQQRLEDVVPVARRAYEVAVRRDGADNATTLAALNNLLNALLRTNKTDEAAALAIDLPARAERVFPAAHPARAYLCLTSSTALRKAGKFAEAGEAARSAYAAACAAFDPYRWETERTVGEVRMTLAALKDQSEETARWGRTAVHIRLVAAGPSERESVLTCIHEVAGELGAASGAPVAEGEVVQSMWKELDQRAPLGDARRARYCANLARAASTLKLRELAQSAIMMATVALRDSPRPEEDKAIVDAARIEADAR